MRFPCSDSTGVRTIVTVGMSIFLFCSASFAEKDEPETDCVSDTCDTKKADAPYRGTLFIYRNMVSALSFKKDEEISYNPYYAMEFSVLPKWWANSVFYTSLGVFIAREITHSDWTSYSGETVLGDVRAALGLYEFYQVPGVKIHISAELGFVVPTSKASKARTLALGFRPGFSFGRTFPLLNGLAFKYHLGLSASIYNYTTAMQENPTIDCPPGLAGCGGVAEATQSSGVRNSPFGITNEFGVALSFNRYISVGASFGLYHSFLYNSTGLNDEYPESWQPLADTNVRYGMFSTLEIIITPMKAFFISFGAETSTAQLKPDASYQTPFFNRYTNFYLDLGLDAAGLILQIKERRREK